MTIPKSSNRKRLLIPKVMEVFLLELNSKHGFIQYYFKTCKWFTVTGHIMRETNSLFLIIKFCVTERDMRGHKYSYETNVFNYKHVYYASFVCVHSRLH